MDGVVEITQIPTALSQKEADALQTLARDRVCMEIGAWYGFSTVLMAQVAKQVWSVDWHLGDTRVGEADTAHAFIDNLDRWHVRTKVVPIFGRSEDVLPQIATGSAELIFIDADHDNQAVLRDARMAVRCLTEEGVMAFHDYGRFFVQDAVDQFHREELPFYKLEVTDTLAVLKWQ